MRRNELNPFPPRYILLVIIVLSLAFWFVTQNLYSRYPIPDCGIVDLLFELTSSINQYMLINEGSANFLLIIIGLCSDLFTLVLIAATLLYSSIRPFLVLIFFILFRQIVMFFDFLPVNEGLIWHDPGFPSFTATYGAFNDLFFSPHVGLGLIGALEIARLRNRYLTMLGFTALFIMVFIGISLRLDYFFSVYSSVMTVLISTYLANKYTPTVDRLLTRLFQR